MVTFASRTDNTAQYPKNTTATAEITQRNTRETMDKTKPKILINIPLSTDSLILNWINLFFICLYYMLYCM